MARLAAFDMDGTLLMPDHRLGEKTLNTLKRLHERNVTLTFATGRHVLEMRHLLGAFALDAFLITGNGTRIHSVEGDVLYRQDLNPEVADIVLHSTWDTPASTSLTIGAGLPEATSRNYCTHMCIAVLNTSLSICVGSPPMR